MVPRPEVFGASDNRRHVTFKARFWNFLDHQNIHFAEKVKAD